jgi:hypothetical protein
MEHQPARATIKFMEQINTTVALMKKDITTILNGLVDNKSEHKEILDKIDHLSDTFQGKIQDKADQKEIINLLDTKYVSKEAFSNVQKIVYTLMGALALAALYFIFRKVGLTL